MLTVIFSTYNGERTLTPVLEGYTRLVPPHGNWKLIVVNNASTDATADILRAFEQQLPITQLYVSSPGKNRALNAALRYREGDLVVLTDDDAIPDPNWLVELRRAADEHTEFDIFAGAIIPRWQCSPEPWHSDWVPLSVTYAITDPHRESGPTQASAAWGPNMAIRSRVFDAGHRFDDLIGPEPGNHYRMGSETEFTSRLASSGYRTWFASMAVVEHIIRDFQMEKAWVLSRAERYGRGLSYRESLEVKNHSATILGCPRWRIRKLMKHGLRLVLARLTRHEKDAFLEAWQLRLEWGYLRETYMRNRISRL